MTTSYHFMIADCDQRSINAENFHPLNRIALGDGTFVSLNERGLI